MQAHQQEFRGVKLGWPSGSAEASGRIQTSTVEGSLIPSISSLFFTRSLQCHLKLSIFELTVKHSAAESHKLSARSPNSTPQPPKQINPPTTYYLKSHPLTHPQRLPLSHSANQPLSRSAALGVGVLVDQEGNRKKAYWEPCSAKW